MSRQTLLGILNQSSQNNTRLHVTGMLIYFEGTFIQVLEGAEDVVYSLLDKISKDARHKDVTVVHDEPIQEREFGAWEMAFRAIDDKQLKATEAFIELDKLKLSSGEAKGLLKTFYELNVRNNSRYQF